LFSFPQNTHTYTHAHTAQNKVNDGGGDDSSNGQEWRSDQEDELLRLISTPIFDAIARIDGGISED